MKNFQKIIYKNIISTSAGNPLFIEEITRNIKSKKNTELSCFQLPDTVQSIVSSRIDLLPIGYKEILYQAAVMGKNFELNLLQKLTDVRSGQLLEVLKELKKSEFILEKETFPTRYFSFKHLVIQEVAYNSLLYKTRRNLHSQLGFAIEESFSNVLETKVEELAYHFKNSDHQDKAIIFYLSRAGDKAQSLYAFKNAIFFYQDCINILERKKPEKEQIVQFSDIYNKLAFSQSVIGERKKAETNLKKALGYCKKINDKELESLILMHIGNLYGDTGQWDRAIEYFKNCLSIIKGIEKLKRKARILKSIGLAYLFKGDTSTGYSYLKKSLKICETIKADDIYAMTLNNIGIYYDMLGKWGKAIEIYKESVNIAQKQKDIINISNFTSNLGFAYSSVNNSKLAIHYLKRSIKAADKIGKISNKGINYLHLGEEYLKNDKFKEVELYISKAEAVFNELEDNLGLADICKLKGMLYKKLKKWDDSEKYFKESIKIYYQAGDKFNEAESYFNWGMMLVKKKIIIRPRKI